MALAEYFQFLDRTKVIYGPGTLESAGDEVRLLGGTKALIVTDAIIRKLGYVDTAISSLKSAGVEVVAIIDDVPQDSGAQYIQNIYEKVKGAAPDVCVGIGGGSVIDTLKMVALLLKEGGDLLADHQGAYVQERPITPMLIVPTTAGTGSEITFAAVIKDHEAGMKLSYVSHYFGPNTAILDPMVTLSMPPKITAFTGMDALTHAVETLVSTEANPVTESLALGAIRMINKWLPVAVKDGENVEARGQMLLASCMAGLAFANSLVGIVHAVAHSVGAVAGVPHGLANSILLPWCMEFNVDAAAEKFALAAQAMGVALTGDDRADALAGVEKVRALVAQTGLPIKLSDVGVSEDSFEDIAALTMGDGSLFTNPRPVEDMEEVVELLKKAF
ncbi:MAG TPA: iron-containing alcohol dehydrogenase [bacterium]|nr:iron-containing alcohol dehydrogenase [bacterium]